MPHRVALALPATLLAASALAQPAPQGPVELPQIQVEGDAERADGPVRDVPQSITVVPRTVLASLRLSF